VVDLGQSIIEPGEEWVELGDDGQPVEAVKAAGPVRMWALSVGTGYWYVAGSVGSETDEPRKATLYTDAERDGMCARDRSQTDAVLVHPDGTVTLDEPAPTIAQPSLYGDSDDVPIALVPVDDVDLVESLTEEIVTMMHEATRIVLEVTSLERQRDEAKARIAARLRGGE
jgi:hypothetical protein